MRILRAIYICYIVCYRYASHGVMSISLSGLNVTKIDCMPCKIGYENKASSCSFNMALGVRNRSLWDILVFFIGHPLHFLFDLLVYVLRINLLATSIFS